MSGDADLRTKRCSFNLHDGDLNCSSLSGCETVKRGASCLTVDLTPKDASVGDFSDRQLGEASRISMHVQCLLAQNLYSVRIVVVRYSNAKFGFVRS